MYAGEKHRYPHFGPLSAHAPVLHLRVAPVHAAERAALPAVGGPCAFSEEGKQLLGMIPEVSYLSQVTIRLR